MIRLSRLSKRKKTFFSTSNVFSNTQKEAQKNVVKFPQIIIIKSEENHH